MHDEEEKSRFFSRWAHLRIHFYSRNVQLGCRSQAGLLGVDGEKRSLVA